MHLSGMAGKFSKLVEAQEIRQIHMYRFGDARLYAKSREWRFGREFIQAGSPIIRTGSLHYGVSIR